MFWADFDPENMPEGYVLPPDVDPVRGEEVTSIRGNGVAGMDPRSCAITSRHNPLRLKTRCCPTARAVGLSTCSDATCSGGRSTITRGPGTME